MIRASKPTYPQTLPQLRVPRTRISTRKLTLLLVIGSIAVLSGYGLISVIPNHFDFAAAFTSFWANLAAMFFTPNVGNDSWAKLLTSLLASIQLAFITTILGAVLGLLFGLMASANLAPRWLATSVKGLMALIRAIPTILWVLIYSAALGLGPNAAVIGLTFHSMAYLAKVYANSIEEIPADTLETLRASGVSFLPLLTQAIMPTLAARFLSWTFIRFEINFANAIVVGAAAGAGGIGYQLYVASNFYFNFHEVGLIIYLILAFVLVLELISTRLRKHIIA
ncbi:PhnE/PtxC family ABC transporter permease [Lacticaseibacillus saniviri]|uniref:Phosphonates abc transporter, permease protein n=2 Tax=Lacticaseibacillus saniviri TaxID=931533 RepID=A0A0R2MTV7_9LACO|nr:ABC transporter permease subunit [Lacticaseibacillus saniviri]KRO16997.1 phosphonates abc transporter, permease protein [Lacticaseibacillus saniviri JCM 17471 = DSM 24301]MCG4281926.1 ABC transporter permease subunit [Lacticaseibacillus saniviri]